MDMCSIKPNAAGQIRLLFVLTDAQNRATRSFQKRTLCLTILPLSAETIVNNWTKKHPCASVGADLIILKYIYVNLLVCKVGKLVILCGGGKMRWLT